MSGNPFYPNSNNDDDDLIHSFPSKGFDNNASTEIESNPFESNPFESNPFNQTSSSNTNNLIHHSFPINGNKASTPKPPKNSILALEFVDVRNNTFSIYQVVDSGEYVLIYDPMNASRSSSGFYSGGSAYSKPISKDQFLKVNSAFTEIDNKSEWKSVDRTMGSTIFKRGNTKFYAEMGVADDFEQLLRSL